LLYLYINTMKYCLSIIAAAALMISCSKNNEPKGQKVRADLVGGYWDNVAYSTSDNGIQWAAAAPLLNGGKMEYIFDGNSNFRRIMKNSTDELISESTGKYFVSAEGDTLKVAYDAQSAVYISRYTIISLAADTLVIREFFDTATAPGNYYMFVNR